MLQHARENDHHFRKEDVTILSSEHNWVKRGIHEAIFIQTLKPSVNIDPGRHKLSSHFDSLLKNIISVPPAPLPHDADTDALISTAPRRQGRPRKETTIPKTIVSHQPEQQPQQRPSQLTQQPQQHSQPLGPNFTRPKTLALSTQPSQGTRQSQWILIWQQTTAEPAYSRLQGNNDYCLLKTKSTITGIEK